MIHSIIRFIPKLAVVAMTILFMPLAPATTLQKFSFQEIVGHSLLIVEGEVLTSDVVADDDLVYTRLLIRVDDVLKGEDPGEFIELDFLGGENDGKTVSIAGQDIPAKGERGFYFIEDLSTRTINPLMGWSQGHYRIVVDDKGVETLESASAQEIMELTASKQTALAEKLRQMKFSSQLIQEVHFKPASPNQLRDAVHDLLSGD